MKITADTNVLAVTGDNAQQSKAAQIALQTAAEDFAAVAAGHAEAS